MLIKGNQPQQMTIEQKLDKLRDGLNKALALAQSANAAVEAQAMALTEMFGKEWLIAYTKAQTRVTASFSEMARKRGDLAGYRIFSTTLQNLEKQAKDLEVFEEWQKVYQETIDKMSGDRVADPSGIQFVEIKIDDEEEKSDDDG